MANVRRILGALGVTLITTLGCAGTAYVVDEPPPPQVEVKPPNPGGRAVWIDGHWAHSHGRYHWVQGHWVMEPKGAWVAGHWAKRPRGYVWVAGHWKH
jgi:hypothetical protein